MQYLPIEDTEHKQGELRQMKFLATSLLAIAFVIFALASVFEKQYWWVGFIRAAAEAAMVGAVADWFAVTALFRHPLNLKIPHTAIIPNRKDVIGQSLGRFVKTNFLSREVITERLRIMNVTGHLAEWLIQAEHSELIAHHTATVLVGAVQVMRDEDVQDLIERSLAAQIRSTQFAPLLGNILSLITSGSRQQELLYGTVKLGARLLEENREVIQEKISQETPWWLPTTVDRAIYQKIVDAVDETLQEVSADPEHPLHENFNTLVEQFVEDLRNSPDLAAREESFKTELLQHSVVQEFSSSLWFDIKTALMGRSASANLGVRRPIRQGLMSFGEAMLNDPALLQKVNRWVEDATLYLIERYGHEVEYLISYTISRWDAEATSRKIELQVGKDLQFIRINGTIVGGLVGLLIHTFAVFFFPK
jgi:uncharacterized membrane-anchored protein YjiN (DUF445 family)